MDDNFVADKGCEQVGNMGYYNHEQSDRVYGAQPCAPTLRTGYDDAKAIKVLEENPIKVGNYGNGHHAKDVFDTNGCSPTITTSNHGLGQTIIDKRERTEWQSKKTQSKATK